MPELRVLSQMILVFIISSASCTDLSRKKNAVNYGYSSRLMTSLIDMNCDKNIMAIYDEYNMYGFRSNEYKFISADMNEIGKKSGGFKIKFEKPDIIAKFIRPKISFCFEGQEYIGRSHDITSSASDPPACHFFFLLSNEGEIILENGDNLVCYSTKFMSVEQYAKEVLGVE